MLENSDTIFFSFVDCQKFDFTNTKANMLLNRNENKLMKAITEEKL